MLVSLSRPTAAMSGGSQNTQVSVLQTIKEDLEQADLRSKKGDINGALKLYEAAAARARVENSPVLESQTFLLMGRLLSRESRYTEARKHLERAFTLAESAGDSELAAQSANSLGIVAADMGSRKEARDWFEKSSRFAEAAGNLRLKARALNNASMLGLQSPSEALALLTQVLEIARSIGYRDLEASVLHGMGDHLFTLGDYAAAFEKLEAAAALYRELSDPIDLARVYTSMGRMNRMHGLPEAAIPFYEQALELQKGTKDKAGIVQSLNAMAIAYGLLGKKQRARELYDEAYAVALTTESPRIIDFARANMAPNLIDLGEYARAAALLEEVLKRGAETNPANRHILLASAYLHMGRLAEARAHADAAVQLSAEKPADLILALWHRGKVRGKQGETAAAMEDVREALHRIEGIRAKLIPLDFMKQGFSASFQNVYSTMIELYEQQGQAEQALEAAEAARARAFLDLLATREVALKDFSSAEIEHLRKTEQLLRNRGIDPYKAAVSAPRNLDEDTAALLAEWKKASPQIQSFASVRPHTTADLIATARRLRSTILSYWTSENAVFIGVVRADGTVRIKRVPVLLSRLSARIESALSPADGSAATIVARGEKTRQEEPGGLLAWQELYRLLIQPVRSVLPATGRLTIIPHGPLMRLSFAALADAKGRYLLEDYAVHYAPAAALLDLFASKKPEKPGGDRKFILVADPELPPPEKGRLPLPPLPGAREEVRTIAGMLPSRSTKIFLGREADHSRVVSSLSGASVAHFATHAVMNDDQPLDSYLALARPAGTQSTGRLSAKDIYGLNLQADLVVLSSCRSAGGRVTGEGISELTRAFFYAGAPSIIASRWDVADQPAGRLLSAFYAEWLQGRSRIDSLRRAQLRLLAELRAGLVIVKTPAGDFTAPEDPSLWAGFILLGAR